MWQDTNTNNPKNKDTIKDVYESNASDKLHCQKRTRKSKYSDINEALYKYYQLVTSRSIYSDGKILTKKGIEIAKKLGNDTSNSWLTQ